MVSPTTQLSYSSTSTYSSGVEVRYYGVRRARQKAPYTLVLPYVRHQGSVEFEPRSNFLGNVIPAVDLVGAFHDVNLMDEASNRAYANLKDKTYDDASLGVDFAEARQSFAMIANRAGQLWQTVRDIKRLDFDSAAKRLGMAAKPPGASKRKSAAGNFLEYQFGWAPLVGSIYDAVEVVNNPLKSFTAQRGFGRITDKFSLDHNYGSVSRKGSGVREHMVVQGATVRAISNSTYHSLDQFGLLNPLTVAWELVPFSFVVDWFANVGDVLASYSDFAGLELDRTFTSKVFRNSISYRFDVNPGYDPQGQSPLVARGTGVNMNRVSGLTAPVFNLNRLKLPSKTRAVTAISLLVQILTKR